VPSSNFCLIRSAFVSGVDIASASASVSAYSEKQKSTMRDPVGVAPTKPTGPPSRLGFPWSVPVPPVVRCRQTPLLSSHHPSVVVPPQRESVVKVCSTLPRYPTRQANSTRSASGASAGGASLSSGGVRSRSAGTRGHSGSGRSTSGGEAAPISGQLRALNSDQLIQGSIVVVAAVVGAGGSVAAVVLFRSPSLPSVREYAKPAAQVTMNVTAATAAKSRRCGCRPVPEPVAV
jgi:hypothetical protein